VTKTVAQTLLLESGWSTVTEEYEPGNDDVQKRSAVGSMCTPNPNPVGIVVPSVLRMVQRCNPLSYATARGWFQVVPKGVPPGLRTWDTKTLALKFPLR